MSPTERESWDIWRNHVLKTLERQDAESKEFRQTVNDNFKTQDIEAKEFRKSVRVELKTVQKQVGKIHTAMAIITVKQKLRGSMYGLIGSAAGLIVLKLIEHWKG